MKENSVQRYVLRVRGRNMSFDDVFDSDIPQSLVLSLSKEKAVEILDLVKCCRKMGITEAIKAGQSMIAAICYMGVVDELMQQKDLDARDDACLIAEVRLHVNASGFWLSAVTNPGKSDIASIMKRRNAQIRKEAGKAYDASLVTEEIISELVSLVDVMDDFCIHS